MEDHTTTQDTLKNYGILAKDEEREKVKDFVYKHFKEVTDQPVLMEQGSARNNRPVRNRGHRVQQGAFFSGKILSFGCSICKDCFTYSPNDLLKHFRLAHRGALPTYPCDLCGFVTNEFSVLQRHRIEHRNTLVTCELCQDDVQYSLLLLTRHYTMCHSINGHFTCDWCHFSTVDAGTFVQHIHHHKETSWRCSKCSHMSTSEVEHQKHLKGHSGSSPDPHSSSLEIEAEGKESPELRLRLSPDVEAVRVDDTQCFLLSSNNPTTGIKKFIAVQNSQNIVTQNSVLQSAVKVHQSEADKHIRAPRPIRPPSQRKRRRKLLFDELPATSHKVRKLSNKALPEKEPVVLWSPVAKDKERTLRLCPLSSDQQIKWPRRCQPVVVLNHPDVDIPEVASLMQVVQRHQGAVTKVSLSQKTIQALSDHAASKSSTKDLSSQPRTAQSSVCERYLLRLKLKRKSRKKYQLVRTVPDTQPSVEFTCWFCGRHFNSQEAWIGHGQRHLLESTRDWHTLEAGSGSAQAQGRLSLRPGSGPDLGQTQSQGRIRPRADPDSVPGQAQAQGRPRLRPRAGSGPDSGPDSGPGQARAQARAQTQAQGRLGPRLRADSVPGQAQAQGRLGPRLRPRAGSGPDSGQTQSQGRLRPRTDPDSGQTQSQGRLRPRTGSGPDSGPGQARAQTQGRLSPRAGSGPGQTQTQGRLSPGQTQTQTQGRLRPRADSDPDSGQTQAQGRLRPRLRADSGPGQTQTQGRLRLGADSGPGQTQARCRLRPRADSGSVQTQAQGRLRLGADSGPGQTQARCRLRPRAD
uniref:C2H2-type domain-containing protein n=1 Tax=Knipowitschia caucasica TaxID=637954 RepID=A0AAV2LIS6_KNICA